jgi:HSP20 family protein
MSEKSNVVEKRNGAAAPEAALLPPVDVIEDSGGITLLADLPGVSKDKLTLQLETDSLTIEGEVGLNLPQEMESSFAEVKVPRYRRVFTLSKELDGEKTSAEFRNGVLKLRIPKAEHAQPRKIAINVA